MSTLEGRVYAVTGGASGIGFARAELLLRLGASVSICDIDATALEVAHVTLRSSYPNDIASNIDIFNPDQVKDWILKSVKEFGGLHGAANVAGIIGSIHGLNCVEDMDTDQWDLTMQVNLRGTMLCMKEELKIMHASGSGSIVNVSSIHGIKGFARHSAYDASKHGVIGLTKSTAQEYGELGIRVNSVSQGEINTPLMMKSTAIHGDQNYTGKTALKRADSTVEIAQVIVFLLSDDSNYVTGANICADGGWSA